MSLFRLTPILGRFRLLLSAVYFCSQMLDPSGCFLLCIDKRLDRHIYKALRQAKKQKKNVKYTMVICVSVSWALVDTDCETRIGWSGYGS